MEKYDLEGLAVASWLLMLGLLARKGDGEGFDKVRDILDEALIALERSHARLPQGDRPSNDAARRRLETALTQLQQRHESLHSDPEAPAS